MIVSPSGSIFAQNWCAAKWVDSTRFKWCCQSIKLLNSNSESCQKLSDSNTTQYVLSKIFDSVRTQMFLGFYSFLILLFSLQIMSQCNAGIPPSLLPLWNAREFGISSHFFFDNTTASRLAHSPLNIYFKLLLILLYLLEKVKRMGEMLAFFFFVLTFYSKLRSNFGYDKRRKTGNFHYLLYILSFNACAIWRYR